MQIIERYQEEFSNFLKEHLSAQEPATLYNPVYYILGIGGKRIRPILTLLSCDVFGGQHRDALYAALAVEIFHNFSLVHDDIMDNAHLRRGQPTVHTKWNLNTGILSGDAMLIFAYQFFEHYQPEVFRSLAKVFSKTALEVCEGQRYDMDFEKRLDVSVEEYLKMIRLKTAVLVGAALKMGAIIAGASVQQQQQIYDFGVALGVAFQLQDDYLDTFGDDTFGKRIGGDILENKKTMLFLKALEVASPTQREALLRCYSTADVESQEKKITQVTNLFKQTKSDEFLRQEVEHYTRDAFVLLEKLDIDAQKKAILQQFGMDLMNRKI